MKYKYNEPFKRRVSVVNIILGLLVVFLLYVAWTCSYDARKGSYDLKVYEDGSFKLMTYDNTYTGCLTGGLCND